MNKLFIVGNLKSYKTQSQGLEWLRNFKKIKELGEIYKEKEIVICPPFTLLYLFKSYFLQNNFSANLGAQNVSPFDEGAYTGEVNARQIKEFADYVLIGHSERRNNFGENDEVLSKKVQISLRYEIKPIYLVQNKETIIPQGVELVAYEPVFAIGTETPDTPENAKDVSDFIKTKGNYQILYGGSITPQNIKSFTDKEKLSGALVGGASLDPNEFIEIIKNS